MASIITPDEATAKTGMSTRLKTRSSCQTDADAAPVLKKQAVSVSYTRGDLAALEAEYIVAVEHARLALSDLDVHIAFLPPD